VRLGTVEERSAADTRKEAQRILRQRHSGVDERAAIELRKREAGNPKALTLGDLIVSCLAVAKDEQRPRLYKETERHLTKHAVPLHREPADSLTRSQVVSLL